MRIHKMSRVRSCFVQLAFALPLLMLAMNVLAWLRWGTDLPFLDDWRAYDEKNALSLSPTRLFEAINNTITPVGLALDLRLGATTPAGSGNHLLQATSTARPLLSAYDGQTLGPGDTYNATGYPIFQLYDGVDDGMATAAFAAGTLTSGMDCMIAVRRASDTPQYGVVGLQNQIQGVCFGVYAVGVGDPCCFGCGSPTVWVNKVQLPSATRGELYTALPVGEWHIVEFRGLDLSAWTALTSGMWGGGIAFNGPRGDILLYPSTASTTDKDKARQYLADKYGVTLP